MNNCENCKYKGNNAEDRCRGCWKDGVWRRWEAEDLEDNTVKSFEAGWNIGYMKGLEDGKMIANPKWIPVTERLPDKSIGYCSEEVLMNDRGIILIGWYDYDAREWCADEYFSLDLVDAWMPLPKPYKPKEETP